MILAGELNDMAKDSQTKIVAEVYESYQKALYEANAMDFDDLLIKIVELFARHPHIKEKYARQFRYILVDEYQDTNRIQYLIIKELSSIHRNITVVGDDAQSIYAFRGADIRNILAFEDDFPDTKLFRLEQNYRSTQHVLDAANALIKNNRNQIPKTLHTQNPKGETVKIIECIDDREEAAMVCRFIEEEIRKDKYDLNEFCVLYRMNAQSRVLEDAFRRNGLAYIIIGGISFYKRKEIKDVLAYIRLLVNPADNESLLRVINFPARGIGEVTMTRLNDYAKEKGVGILSLISGGEAVPGILPRAVQKLREFSELIKKYSQMRDVLSASELLRSYIDETGIPQELKMEGTEEATNRYENVREFLSAITEYFQSNETASIETFLQETSLLSDVDQLADAANSVRLMTLHSAKGLEFPVVFVTGLEEGIFPGMNSADDPAAIEEERRLLYVGITRAMKKCYVLHAQSRLRYGSVQYSMPSRFLEELEETESVERTKKYSGGTRPRAGVRSEGDPFGDIFTPTAFTPPRRTFNRSNGFREPSKSYYSQESSRDNYSQIEEGSNAGLKRGARVWHDSFGEGRVIEVSGRGEKAKAVVDFPSAGRKNLMLKFANLRVL
jgi:DNA helicase-2/ATP-dependent DNA helicase PcrA